MKYCEKCGNKLKEGYAFCDKCGAKVNTKEKEDKEDKKELKEKEESIKEEIKEPKHEHKPVPPVLEEKPPKPPKKPGRGKIVFLTILNILLLAATITFLILWLTKSTSCDETPSNYKDGGNVTKPTSTPEPVKEFYIGKWEQNVEYKSGSTVTRRTYGSIELKEDGTFRSLFYDKDDVSGTKEEIEGTYTYKNDNVTFTYKVAGSKETLVLEFYGNKLCLNDECDDYLVKDSYDNKITIYDDDDDYDTIETIDYSEYLKLQKEYKDAIVVVVKAGCSWCEKYESVVEEITEYYTTPVYYYKFDSNISVNGTPTTIIIKNGYIVDTIEGYKEYSDVEDILDKLGVK